MTVTLQAQAENTWILFEKDGRRVPAASTGQSSATSCLRGVCPPPLRNGEGKKDVDSNCHVFHAYSNPPAGVG